MRFKYYDAAHRERNNYIEGDTLEQAVKDYAKILISHPDSEHIVKILSDEITVVYDEGIFGATGGYVASIPCIISTGYAKDSEKYAERKKIYDAWIYAPDNTKSDRLNIRINPETKEQLQKLADADCRTLSSYVELLIKQAIEKSKSV